MSRKSCDMIVSNRSEAMNSETNSVEVLLHGGHLLQQIDGPKTIVAQKILELIQKHLIQPTLL
jgi:acyl-CoA hydrolase